MRKECLVQFVEKLYVAITQGLVVTIFTRPLDDFKGAMRKAMEHNHNYLQSQNIRVEYIPNLQQKFTIIDQNIVWYGNIRQIHHKVHLL